jgi:hypothetical protein
VESSYCALASLVGCYGCGGIPDQELLHLDAGAYRLIPFIHSAPFFIFIFIFCPSVPAPAAVSPALGGLRRLSKVTKSGLHESTGTTFVLLQLFW